MFESVRFVHGEWSVHRAAGRKDTRFEEHFVESLLNMVFVESPVGVGFSIPLDKRVPPTDNSTMQNAYQFISNFLTEYPEFASNDVYISGESYGGHYVPELAWYLLQQQHGQASPIRLRGIFVGNPYADDVIDGGGVVPFLWGHALISYSTWRLYEQACNASQLAALSSGRYHDFRHPLRRFLDTPRPRSACHDALVKAYKEVDQEDTDQYDIYTPCVRAAVGLGCENYTALTNYLNQPAVREAIHVSPLVKSNWSMCSDVNYQGVWPSVLPLFASMFNASLHVTIYSGDVTFNCPFTGSAQWIEAVGAPSGVVEDWTPWFLAGQIAGYKKRYGTISFVTVKHSGHMVPLFTPASALELFQMYLAGTI